MKNLVLLGSTGSIGTGALDVIGRHRDRFRVAALAAGRNIGLLKEQILAFRPAVAAVIDEEHALRLREALGREGSGTAILWGPEGYGETASLKEADLVLSAMVGAAGLVPTMAAVEAGKDVALANKETLVTAGAIVMERAAGRGVRLIPVDSEHSAIFQCLEGRDPRHLKRILLTASGGPFFRLPGEEFGKITAADALRHPNWVMGRKITIDSATMMNKGLEVIEARWLFGVDAGRIEVIIHPQSIVHSMVEFHDGSVLAQLGVPDMRVPLSYALGYPDRLEDDRFAPDFLKTGPLEFLPPDRDRFPCLELAFRAVRKGGSLPAVLNGANEIAVEAFLSGRISFTAIPAVIEKTLDAHESFEPRTIGEVLAADRWSREEALRLIEEKRERS